MTRPASLMMVMLASWTSLSAQEKPVPKDSARFSIAGCARGRVFTVDRHPEHELRGVDFELGSKIRLQGPRVLLNQLKANERSMVEITGLMKQADVRPPGIGLAGGRVRITPVMPAGRGVARDPGPAPPVIDVESWRLLNASCPR
jgi:hypothetical protein